MCLIYSSCYAGKITIDVENESFEHSTKLKGAYIHTNNREKSEDEFILEIPSYKGKGTSSASMSLDIRLLNILYLVLVTDNREKDNDEEETILAMANFKPVVGSIKALKIRLKNQQMLIRPTYNLPPTFSQKQL